jgi:ribonuclease BN (tRNA processing enzyme)
VNLELRVLGCRGSMAVTGDSHRRYGGNTTCFEIEAEPGHHLMIDGGTGLRSLQREAAGGGPLRYSILLTHYHWDHIQGLPAFQPLFEAGNQVTIYGPRFDDRGVAESLGAVIRPPWWPISLEEVAADVSFRDLSGPFAVGPISVRHAEGSHPQGVVFFRLEGPNRSVVIATDHEAGDTGADARLISLASKSDVLVHDAQYTPDEVGTTRKGWGHSSYESAVRAAQDAGANRLVLTSHDPDRTDEDIDRLRSMARAMFPNTDAAYEGMTIPL